MNDPAAPARPMHMAGRWRRWADSRPRAAAVPRVLILIGLLFAANVALWFPGAMNNDSINQYAEAVSGRYTDWHPPVMAWLWSLLRRLHDGPAPLYVLHLAGYWSGLGLFADATRRAGSPRAGMLIALAGLFPTFVFLNTTVTKDVGMVAAWLPAIGLLYWFRSQQRRVPLAAGVAVAILLAYGTLVRSNAVFALGPLLLFALVPAQRLRTGHLLAAAVGVALLAIPLAQQANRALFHPVQRDAVHSLFLFDLAGIAAHEGDPALLVPRATLDAAALHDCYTPYWWDSFSPWGACGARVSRPDTDHVTGAEGLVAQWARTVAAHPLAYARHRLKHFNSSLMFAVPLKHIRLTPEYRGVNPQFKPLETVTPRDVQFDLVRKNPTVWPVTWIVWALALLAFLRRFEPSPPMSLARALLVSALGYSLAYLVIGVATDIRYHYWAILATLLASLAVLPQLGAAWRGRSRPLRWSVTAVGLVIILGLVARLADFQAWST